MIRIKRIYESPSSRDGLRVLVDRVWPRGVSKQRARIHEWRKDLAPSTTLRKWFGHDPAKWPAFRLRYRNELTSNGREGDLQALARLAKRKTVTLLYSAADDTHNQAVVLRDFLEELAAPSSPPRLDTPPWQRYSR
ncbi:MAG: DUF488 domain-containing protein [Nitrospirales bacterium]